MVEPCEYRVTLKEAGGLARERGRNGLGQLKLLALRHEGCECQKNLHLRWLQVPLGRAQASIKARRWKEHCKQRQSIVEPPKPKGRAAQ